MLIFNAVENGAVTTVCAALNLAFYLTRPLDYIHLCLYVSCPSSLRCPTLIVTPFPGSSYAITGL